MRQAALLLLVVSVASGAPADAAGRFPSTSDLESVQGSARRKDNAAGSRIQGMGNDDMNEVNTVVLPDNQVMNNPIQLPNGEFVPNPLFAEQDAKMTAALKEAAEDAKEESVPDNISEVESNDDEIPGLEDNSVLGLVGQRMLRYMNPDNTQKIRDIIEKPAAMALVASIYDKDGNGEVAATEWEEFYDFLANYYQFSLGKMLNESVIKDEWMTTNVDKNDKVEVANELYSTLFSKTTEPLFEALAVSLIQLYDEDRSGFLEREATMPGALPEWTKWKMSPVVAQFDALPPADTTEVKNMLKKIEVTQGSEETKKVMSQMVEDKAIKPAAN